jgi:LDH2 family malate/lactate/ureidoglycolate dehydrogenase
MIVTAAAERELIVSVLSAYGAPPAAAALQARWLVEADLRDVGSHGLQRLPMLVRRIERGLIAPAADPDVSWRTSSVLVVDGRRGFGPVAGLRAVQECVERARSAGLALAAVGNANHLGILAPYVEAAADHGMIGIAATTSEALVHPFGGRVAMIGTNPLAIAVPARPGPLVLDMATGEVSMGRILRHARAGQPIPPGWALDAAGEPTTDPAAAAAISPFGGAKGSGLGLALEVLVATLTASALGRDVHGTLDADDACNKGDVFLVADPSALPGGSQAGPVSEYLDAVRATPVQEGAAAVRVPGDRARAERARRQRAGVEVPDRVWHEALELARGQPASVNDGRRGVTPPRPGV